MSEMTGLERLRALGREQEERSWSTVGKVRGRLMLQIAEQIEDKRFRERLAVERVASEMESHCLGHEGMEDSPVARWARELREALGGDERDPADERDAIAWVREHGGIAYVKDAWNVRRNLDRQLEKAQAKVERQQRHIESIQSKLSERREHIENIANDVRNQCLAFGVDVSECDDEFDMLHDLNEALSKRLMPEGMEWPRFQDGEPVPLGGEVTVTVHNEDGDFDRTLAIRSIKYKESGVLLEGTKNEMVVLSYGECVKRPAPKVLDADGAEIRVGDTVWTLKDARELEVTGLYPEQDSCPVKVKEHKNGAYIFSGVEPSDLTHQRHVLDADGNRIEPAMDVWWVCEGDERGVHAEKLHVESIGEDGLVTCDPFNGGTWVELEPFELYVHKPVLGADGVPIHEGDTVWCMATNDELTDMNIVRKNWPTMRAKLTVKSIISDSHGDKWADFEETYLYVKTCYLTHTNPGPRRTCQDCRFWQKDPTARTMGVCWRNYAERDCEDSYEARTEDAPACEYFRERGE